MVPKPYFKGAPLGETLVLIAIIGALSVLALAVLRIAVDGAAETVNRVDWWLRYGTAEAVFVVGLVVLWMRSRNRPT